MNPIVILLSAVSARFASSFVADKCTLAKANGIPFVTIDVNKIARVAPAGQIQSCEAGACLLDSCHGDACVPDACGGIKVLARTQYDYATTLGGHEKSQAKVEQDFENYLSSATGKRAYDGINMFINGSISLGGFLTLLKKDQYFVLTIGANLLERNLNDDEFFKKDLRDSRVKALFVDFRVDEKRPKIPERDNVYLLANRVQKDLQEKYPDFTIVKV